MKIVILSLFLLVTSQSFAEVLLDCNIGQGDDQQAVIEKVDTGYVLKELTTKGSWVKKELAEDEWESKRIQLSADDYTADYVLYYDSEDKAWRYRYESDGFNAYGYADCAN